MYARQPLFSARVPGQKRRAASLRHLSSETVLCPKVIEFTTFDTWTSSIESVLDFLTQDDTFTYRDFYFAIFKVHPGTNRDTEVSSAVYGVLVVAGSYF